MTRKAYTMRFDVALMERAREVARRERRSLTNLIEVAVAQYLQQQEGGQTMVEWTIAPDGAYEARVGKYRLKVWYDTRGPKSEWGWAYRVTGPEGAIDEGPADNLDEAQRLAEEALPKS